MLDEKTKLINGKDIAIFLFGVFLVVLFPDTVRFMSNYLLYLIVPLIPAMILPILSDSNEARGAVGVIEFALCFFIGTITGYYFMVYFLPSILNQTAGYFTF